MMEIILRRPSAALLLAVPTLFVPFLVVANFWPRPHVSVLSFEFLVWFGGFVPWFIPSVIFQAWIALQAERGEDDSPLGESVSRVIPFFLAAVGVWLVTSAGLLALVIPGVIWAVACTGVIPAAAVERLGPMDAIKRTLALTKNRRWSFFGGLLAMTIPLALGSTLVELGFAGGRFEAMGDPLIKQAVRPILDTIGSMLGAALAAAFYSELVRLERSDRTRNTTISGTSTSTA
jgi:hypothetical protein